MSEADSYSTLGSALRITALSISDVAKVLSRTGGRRITEAMVREDLDEGAPANPDGTINLIHYGAWLAREVSHVSD